MAKLKLKHARLKENKRLRTPPSSPQAARRRLRSQNENTDDEGEPDSRRNSKSTTLPAHLNHHDTYRRASEAVRPSSGTSSSLSQGVRQRRQSSPSSGYSDAQLPPPYERAPERASGDQEEGARGHELGVTNASFVGDSPTASLRGEHTTVIAIGGDDSISSTVNMDGVTRTKC